MARATGDAATSAMSNFLLYATSVLAWGSTWLAINFQLGKVSPEVSLVYRYVLAAAILFAWCLLRRKKLKFSAPAHAQFALMGLALFGLNYLATYSAQQYISSALNALAFSSMVWMNIINARIFFATRSDASVYLGASLGMAGVVILFWPQLQELSLSDATFKGAALCLGGALVASFGNMVSQRTQRAGLPVVQSNAWGMFYGAAFNGGVALVLGRPFVFDYSPTYVGSLLYLTVVGSVVAFGCYLTLLGRIGAHKAGYAVVMFPVVAVTLSVLFEGLLIDRYLICGLLLVLGGNLSIIARRDRATVAWNNPSPAIHRQRAQV